MKKERSWKFNIIDLLAIIIIIAVVGFLAVKLFSSRDAEGTKPEQLGEMKYVVEVRGLQKDIYDSVAAMLPCKMAASGKMIEDAYIESVSCQPCTVEYLEAASPVNPHFNRWLKTDGDEQYVDAFFYCTATIDYSDLLNMVGTQEVRVGRMHYIKSVDFELVGTIISIEKENQ